MTPIESIYDYRLVVLLNTIISLTETLSLQSDQDPNLLLAEVLFKQTRKVLQVGEESPLTAVQRTYPLLLESLD
jgi:hypothetical protein